MHTAKDLNVGVRDVHISEPLRRMLASLWARREEVYAMMGHNCPQIPCRFGA